MQIKTLSIEMRFEPANLAGGLAVLVASVGPTQAKSGCRSCSVERDVVDQGLVHYHEQWNCSQAFRNHVRSEEFRRVLVALDLCSQEPQVLLGDMAATCGMEALRALRQGDSNMGCQPEDRP